MKNCRVKQYKRRAFYAKDEEWNEIQECAALVDESAAEYIRNAGMDRCKQTRRKQKRGEL